VKLVEPAEDPKRTSVVSKVLGIDPLKNG